MTAYTGNPDYGWKTVGADLAKSAFGVDGTGTMAVWGTNQTAGQAIIAITGDHSWTVWQRPKATTGV